MNLTVTSPVTVNRLGERLSFTEVVHQRLAAAIHPGETVVDATVGNGHDTLFLAQLVGPEGRVHGFDVQAAAIEASQRRLQEAGVAGQVSLHLLGHEQMVEVVAAEALAVAVAVFNLGYLPRSDKRCTTLCTTTLAALQVALARLRVGGLLSVMAYPGHAEGLAEAQAVRAWAESLDPQHYRYSLTIPESDKSPPQWSLIERLA